MTEKDSEWPRVARAPLSRLHSRSFAAGNQQWEWITGVALGPSSALGVTHATVSQVVISQHSQQGKNIHIALLISFVFLNLELF